MIPPDALAGEGTDENFAGFVLVPGSTFAGYRVDRVLGAGGMGVVYAAHHERLNRPVALKVVNPGLGADQGFRKRFEREGRLQASLDHPNVVTVHEAGEHDGLLYIAMRLVPGRDLKALMSASPLAPEEALRLLAQVADALDAAHAIGLVHRDVKPQNILVHRGQAFLADFGLVRGADETHFTETGQFLGSIPYIAPEQIQGLQPDGATDVYALAAVLHEVLTGSVPYPRPNEAAALYAHMHAEIPKVTDRRPDLPSALDAVVGRGLAKDPRERPQPASVLIAAAIAALETRDRTVTAPSPTVPVSPPAELRTPLPVDEVPARTPPTEIVTPPVPEDPTPADLRPAPASRPDPPRAPRRPAAPGAPARRRAVVGAVLALLAGGAGVAVAGAGGDAGEPAAGPGRTLEAGPVRATVPTSWRTAAPPGEEVGLDLETGAAAPGADAAVGLGTAADVGPTLLPAAVVEEVGPDRLDPELVRIGDREAMRYRALRLPDSRAVLDLVAMPTEEGAALLACEHRGTAAARACEDAAASLVLEGEERIPLSPDPAFAERLDAALGPFDTIRTQQRRRLREARTPAGQADAARRLAAASRSASTRVADTGPPPRARDAVAAARNALSSGARAYDAMVAALRREDARTYSRAGAAARDADRDLDAALRGLEAVGYRLS